MSKVISFRLSKDNPREAPAYEILKARFDKGYSFRHTITEALLRLDGPGLDSIAGASFDDINQTLNQVRELLEQIGAGDRLGIYFLVMGAGHRGQDHPREGAFHRAAPGPQAEAVRNLFRRGP